jgi:cytochrome b561
MPYNEFTSWFYMHGFIMLLLAFPIALAGIGVGFKYTKSIQTGGNFSDGHKKLGLGLLILILIQVPLGLFIHYVKFGHGRVPGHRAIQNYFHAILGLVIVALAFEQVHQGIKTEWFEGTGGNPPVPQSAERAWIGWTIVRFQLLELEVLYSDHVRRRSGFST